jgi:hypothetical protein
MKHRDLTTPLLDPEVYIHLARVLNVQPKPKGPSLWHRLAKFAAQFKGKGSSGGALWLALFLVACSPRPEPRAIDHASLVWVQPKQNDKPKAGTLPRFEF